MHWRIKRSAAYAARRHTPRRICAASRGDAVRSFRDRCLLGALVNVRGRLACSRCICVTQVLAELGVNIAPVLEEPLANVVDRDRRSLPLKRLLEAGTLLV